MASKPGTPPDVLPEPLYDDNTSASSTPPDRKGKKASKNKGDKKGKGVKIFLIILLIFVLLIGGTVVIIALNIGGFRENVIMPYLRNAPLIGTFFPDAESAYDSIADMTPEQLREEVERLQAAYNGRETRVRQLEEDLANANARINNDLIRYYMYWNEFREAQAQLGQVLTHHDPQSFLNFLLQYHNLLDLEHIPQLIEEATFAAEFDAEVREMVRTLSNMDEAAAGEVLENWMLTNTAFMVLVLRDMGASMRGEIMETLEANVRANMLLLMSEPPPIFTPIIPYLRDLPPPIEPTQGLTPIEEPESDDDEYEAYEYDEENEIETEEDPMD
ncbi:MAG: hypothetical protein FWE05_08565 [Defluviitaleaceae bacterium]|nr:hypothetical protein [Defluviitaleaceae bacterium]